MGSNNDRAAIDVYADLDAVVGLLQVKGVDVVFEHRIDQFRHARATRALGDEVGFILDRGQGICDSNGISACLQERVVVFGVADRHHVVRGEAKILARRFQAAGLVDAGRQHHDRTLVEYDLQLKSVFPDRLENQLFVWLPGRDNGPPDGKRVHPLLAQASPPTLPRVQGRAGVSFFVAGSKSNAPFSATTRSKRSIRGKTRTRSGSSRPVTRRSRLPDRLKATSASAVASSTTPSCASVPS